MAGRWAQPFKDRKEVNATLNSMGLSFHICWFLGAIFAILGLIAGAVGSTLGLEPTYWLLLAIAAFLAGIPMLVTWAVALHLLGIGSNSKKGK
jgi:ABC-type lipoprotein release transport system permease subunit